MLKQRNKRLSKSEMEEETKKTLYVRLPHTIKSKDEILNMFSGDFRIKLPRQSTRHCFVVFKSIDEKIKNFEAVKNFKMDDKPVIISNPRPRNYEKQKKIKEKQKKIKIPKPEKEIRVNK